MLRTWPRQTDFFLAVAMARVTYSTLLHVMSEHGVISGSVVRV